MEVTVLETTRGVPVVRLSGDMRLWGKQDTADQIRETVTRLMANGRNRIVLNLAQVERIDSRGIGCLARCQATAITQGCELYLVLTHGYVLDSLTKLNFVRVCPIYPDESSAVAAAGAAMAS
jgi:anti-anti-sigma factor